MVYWLINMIVAMIAWQKATVIRQMYRFIFILTSVLRAQAEFPVHGFFEKC